MTTYTHIQHTWRQSVIALLTAAVLPIVQTQAIPAQRRPFTVTNSDNTQLTLMLCGDEHYHFHTTTDGIPAVQDELGDWHLVPEWADSIAAVWKERRQQRSAHRQHRAAENKARRAFGYPTTYTGQKKGIVILVNYANKSMKSTSTQQQFDDMFNQEGYNKNYSNGSVHDYFLSQSYGKFDLTFDVVGPVTVSQDYAYYGTNNSDGNDRRAATLVAEACMLANSMYPINWGDYDWDDDGEVDQVYIIYAGYGEHAGAPSTTIWPHEWSLSDAQTIGDGKGAITLGGHAINTYAISCELSGIHGSTMNGIGTACHEFSHCLGLPDFYDTSYNGGFGMDAWDVMDQGSYNGQMGNGECPSGFTAYERWFAGWLEFTELDEPTTITDMPCLQDEPVAYKIVNDGNPNEYFTLENRQAEGWFKYVLYNTSIHGMLAIHVDYDPWEWVNDTPNKQASHQRMSIIPANGSFGTYNPTYKSYSLTAEEYRSQLFSGNTTSELTNTSHTACGGKLFSSNTDGTYHMNKPITNIVESNGLISFDFMGGSFNNAITLPSTSEADRPQYYNLQGMPVTHPTQGIYLQRTKEGTRKVAVK